jgi:hypothetical protein
VAKINLGIIGGVVLAIFIAAWAFLEAGQFSGELKKIGNGLLGLAIAIVVIVVAVVLAIEWKKQH